MSWVGSLVKTELKKISEYRANFYSELFGYVAAYFSISYFVWLAVFNESGKSEISGYSFPMMVFYALLVPLIGRATYADDYSDISDEIYAGELNKYLIYPVPFGVFKFIQRISKNSIIIFQMFLAVFLFGVIWGIPKEITLNVTEVLFFLLLLAMSLWLSFLLALFIQLISFWADHVWSLMVCYRFVVHLAGGAWVPLSMFPDSVADTLRSLPMYLVVGFPLEFLMGKLSTADCIYYFILSLVWSVTLYAAVKFIWIRGLKTYSGVGI